MRERAGTEVLHQHERSEIAKLPLVSDRENSAQALQVHVFRPDFMIARRREAAHFVENLIGSLADDLEHRLLRRHGIFVRSASHAGTWPPWSGRLANPERFICVRRNGKNRFLKGRGSVSIVVQGRGVRQVMGKAGSINQTYNMIIINLF